MVGVMTAESRRHDLYNGLTELLGVDRADTLMAHLPTHQFDDLATRGDFDRLSDRIDNVESGLTIRIDNVERSLTKRIDRLESDLTNRFDILNQRIDRIVLTLAAGLFAIIATMIAQGFL